MKRACLILLILTGLATNLAASVNLMAIDEVTISGSSLDSAGFYIAPDSVRIILYRNGAELSDAWYNAGDAQCSALNNMLCFSDQVQDIDGAGGDGLYELMAGFFEDDGDLYQWKTVWFHVGVDLSELARIGDSIDAYDGWLAQQATVVGITDSVNALLDSLQDGSAGIDVNLVAVSGDTPAADNLETMLDGTGGQTLSLGQLNIVASGNNSALVAYGSGTGSGILAWGGDSGGGLSAHGGANAGAAITGYSPVGQGLYLVSDGDQPALLALATGAGLAAHFSAVGSGQGVMVTSDSAAALIVEANNSGNALSLISPDIGLLIDGTTTDLVADLVVQDTNASGESLAVKPGDWSAADSTAYQGSASGLDSATVARAVWNTPGTNHTITGSFGDRLDAKVSSFGPGDGSYATNLVAYDSATAQVVAGVRVFVYNLDQSALMAATVTNTSGTAAANLDADSLVVVMTAPGYLFTPFDTLVISGPATDTVFGYRFDPGAPSSPSLCRVYGFLYAVDGQAESEATVAAHLPRGVERSGLLLVSPHLVSTVTDSLGYFYLDLIPSDSLLGAASYEISISRSDGSILRKRLSVPAASSWQLTW